MRHRWKPSLLYLVVAISFVGSSRAAELPKEEDEQALARLNCTAGDAPAGWKPISQWTFRVS